MSDAPSVSVIFPTGMLGGGFPAEGIERGIELGADAIAVDAGSTDSGPYYLGTGTAKTTEAAVERDLHVLLTSARAADIPVVVTSCGTAGRTPASTGSPASSTRSPARNTSASDWRASTATRPPTPSPPPWRQER